MARGLNRATLIGRVGRDPEIRFTQNGDPVANFSIATGESWTDKNGQKQERTEWHNITIFGKLAEVVKNYVNKGTKLLVEGKIVTEKYTGKDGTEKRSTKIQLSGYGSTLLLLDSKNSNGGNASNSDRNTERVSGAGDRDNGGGEFQADDDDVPFSVALVPLLGMFLSLIEAA